MTSQRPNFILFTMEKGPVKVDNSNVIESIGYGTVITTTIVRGGFKRIKLHNLVYSPDLMHSPISSLQSRRNGFRIVIDEKDGNTGHEIIELWHKPSGDMKMAGVETETYDRFHEAIIKVDGDETNVTFTESKPE